LTERAEEDKAIRKALDIADKIRNSWTRADIKDLVERSRTIGGLGEVIRKLKEKGLEKQISAIPSEHREIAIETIINAL
jgi:hypothetical protein